MSVSEYATSFIDKMKLVPYLVPTELSKVNKFGNGLPPEFGPMVKQATTSKTAIWATKNLDPDKRKGPRKR